MNYLEIAQYMAAAAFLTIAMIYLVVWLRAHSDIVHLLFALTAAAAGVTALAECWMYRASTIGDMTNALRWYVAISGFWAIATVCFFAAYGHVGRVGWSITLVITVVCGAAIIINLFSPYSYLFTEIKELREITLPWGERIRLAAGENNPLRIVTDLAFLAMIVVVADGCYQLWNRNQRARGVLFGVMVSAFMVCFGTHAFLVDTGRIDSPYLSTYGFLALVALMNYELAGEVRRKIELATELKQKDTELHTAVVEERSRIAGELHDSVTQTLFSTAAIADALPAVWKRSPEDARRGMDDLKQLTKGALAEMRTLLHELRPAALVEKNLGELLQELVNATAGRTRVLVELNIEGNTRFPDEVQITLYRIAQESINNVLKHALAKHVWLQLEGSENRAVLTIRDDGCGFDEKEMTNSGLGLEIMRDRVHSIGSQLELDSRMNMGTTIKVHWSSESR